MVTSTYAWGWKNRSFFARHRSWVIQRFHQSHSIKEVQVVFPLPVPWRRFLSTSRDRSRLHIKADRRHDGFTGSGRCGDRLRQLTLLNLKHYWNRRHCAAGRTARVWGKPAIWHRVWQLPVLHQFTLTTCGLEHRKSCCTIKRNSQHAVIHHRSYNICDIKIVLSMML